MFSPVCIFIVNLDLYPVSKHGTLTQAGTLTAPLDRMKVYLIANVGTADPISAAKNGDGVKAVRQLGLPLKNAAKELWKAGGMRSLFAGT